MNEVTNTATENNVATQPDLPQQQHEVVAYDAHEVAGPSAFSASSLILDQQAMVSLYKLAEVMAGGVVTVPKHLAGNVADCLAVAMQAMQWGFNPFAVAQKTHLVSGTLGYESQLIIAALNQSKALASRLNFRWTDNAWPTVNKDSKDDAYAVECWATMRGESEPRTIRVSMAQVGSVRNSPLWVNDPRQQLAYLAAKRWGRLHAPDVILGVYSPDELAERVDGSSKVHNQPGRLVAAAAAATGNVTRQKELVADFEKIAKEQGFEAVKAAWAKLSKDDRAALTIAERDRIGAMAQEQDKTRGAAT